jgi:hypothetical protein
LEELKLYVVTDLSTSPCWFILPARNKEEAILKCIEEKNCPISKQRESNCKVEELQISGYEIKVLKRSS